MAVNENSLKNLQPIKPGEVRNPEGKNGSDWVKAFRAFIGSANRDGDSMRIENVWRAAYTAALKGNVGAQKLLIEQLQGRAVQQFEVSGKDGSPLGFLARDPREMTSEEIKARLDELKAKAKELSGKKPAPREIAPAEDGDGDTD